MGSTNSAIVIFGVFVILTIVLTWTAARRTRSTGEFLVAGNRITAGQNGLALAGDFIGASAFLGVTGIAALRGYDAMVFAVSLTLAWPLMLFLLAEPLRVLGKYTFADVIEYRLGNSAIKKWTALATVVAVFSILTFQLAGAGAVIKLLFGLSYAWSVIVIGGFMLVYVMFGGMVATTWLQVIKIILLLLVCLVLLICLLTTFGFNPGAVLAAATEKGGQGVLAPSSKANTLQLVSLAIASTLGVASLPQVLLRFYTVPDASAARRSMFYASVIVGATSIGLAFIGYGIMAVIGPEAIRAAEAGGNMAIPLLANYYGGPIFLGLVAAIAFATILAAVCGILLAGSAALAHDFWGGVVRGNRASEREQFFAARLAALLLCIGGIALAVLVEGQNIFILSALSGTIAASTIFPSLVLAIYWRGLSYAGAVSGLLTGLISSLVMLWFSPLVQMQMLAKPIAVIDLGSPVMVSVPLAFIVTIVVSMMTKDAASAERFTDMERKLDLAWQER